MNRTIQCYILYGSRMHKHLDAVILGISQTVKRLQEEKCDLPEIDFLSEIETACEKYWNE